MERLSHAPVTSLLCEIYEVICGFWQPWISIRSSWKFMVVMWRVNKMSWTVLEFSDKAEVILMARQGVGDHQWFLTNLSNKFNNWDMTMLWWLTTFTKIPDILKVWLVILHKKNFVVRRWECDGYTVWPTLAFYQNHVTAACKFLDSCTQMGKLLWTPSWQRMRRMGHYTQESKRLSLHIIHLPLSPKILSQHIQPKKKNYICFLGPSKRSF